jgi:hypothetical protein
MIIQRDEVDRRNRGRQRIAYDCELYLSTTGERFEAILRSLDAGWARVKLKSTNFQLTGQIRLQTKTEDHGMFRVVWQKGREVGLQTLVVSAQHLADIPADSAQTLTGLAHTAANDRY